MQIDQETYLHAATEHVGLARELYEQGHYVYAVYVSGVSVECILRAHLESPEFDARHDLRGLLRDSSLLQRLPPRHVPSVSAALATLWSRWRNTHRYFSAARLKRFVVERGLHHRVKGDPVKETARQAVESANTIVSQGAKRWMPSSTK